MPTDKKIEEAVKVANTITANILEFPKEPSSELGRLLVIMRDAYLSMKAERDWWENHCKDWEASRNEMEAERDKYKADCELLTVEKQHKQNCYDNLKESARQNDVELNKEIDKYKAIVEAVKLAHRIYSDDGRAWLECRDIDKALALRENKGE